MPLSSLEQAEGMEAMRRYSKADRKARKGKSVAYRNHQPV